MGTREETIRRGELAFGFSLVGRDRATGARAGLLQTPHGQVATPVFMPVGTQATVKAISPDELRDAGAQIILSNTYHLYLRPGHEVVAALGGLHSFSGWDGPILTDSGGFQVFSLARRPRRGGSARAPARLPDHSAATEATAHSQAPPCGPADIAPWSESLVEIGEEGVTFRSHLDGTVHRFTPESAIAVQEALGADVIMAFDECSTTDDDYEATRRGMERTHRWAERCRSRWLEMEVEKAGRPPQALFGIVQGGAFRDLRRASAEVVSGLGLPGIAVGGESIGYSKPLTRQILEWIGDLLPPDRPRYAMGVGDPEDFFAVVERGIDMFDSVLPTRVARTGTLLTASGRLRVVNAEHSADPRPPEPGCDCYTCRRFSRAYLRHLFKSEALLAYRLATLHNVRFCLRLVGQIRQSILENGFAEFRDDFLSRQAAPGVATGVGTR